MLTKYSPYWMREFSQLPADESSPNAAMARFAAVLEHGGQFGVPISDGRWLLIVHEPPEDRVGVEAEFLSPEWSAEVINEPQNWRVTFLFDDRATAVALAAALFKDGSVDHILDEIPRRDGAFLR